MNGKAQAQYILSLPIEEWEAIKRVLASIKSSKPEVLSSIIKAHQVRFSREVSKL